jgi:hypothetical protein
MKSHEVLLAALVAGMVSGCSSSPWRREVLYVKDGVTLYREFQPAESGSKKPLGYRHPFEIPREKAAILFSQLVYKVDYLVKKDVDRIVFTPAEVEALAEPLTIATGALTPDDRLRFLVTRSNWTDIVLGTTGTSGVVFSAEEGVVSVAFDIIEEKISGADEGDPKTVQFHIDPVEYDDADPVYPGEGMRIHVAEDGRKFPRWLDVRLADLKSRVPPAAAGVAAAPAPAATAPPTGAAPTATPAPTAGPAPAATAEDADSRYRRVRERLNTLKRLRADGALTEEEYQKEYAKALSEL